MENEILKKILSSVTSIAIRLDKIEEQESCLIKKFDILSNNQFYLQNEFNEFRDEQIAFRNEFDEFRDEQIAFRNKFDEFRNEQIAFRNKFDEFRNEEVIFRKRTLKELADLRTDVDTIYALEMDTRKTLEENTKTLAQHSKLLEQCVCTLTSNLEQHQDFDKRISFVESVVS